MTGTGHPTGHPPYAVGDPPADGRSVVIGPDWQYGRLSLLHVDDSQEMTQRPLAAGTHVEVHVEHLRHRCTGWIDFSVLTEPRRRPCPDHHASRGQCDACRRREGFATCIRCDGHACKRLAPAQESFCRSEHVLYLAWFGSGHVKAGVAASVRYPDRLDEQGPVAALVAARGPGPSVKRLEASLHRCGLTSAVTHRRKADLLTGPPAPVEQGREALDQAHSRLTGGAIFQPPEVTVLAQPERYVPPPATTGVRERLHDALVIDVVEGRSLAFTVLGAIGSVLVVEDRSGVGLVDLWLLRGATVTWRAVTDTSRAVQGLPTAGR